MLLRDDILPSIWIYCNIESTSSYSPLSNLGQLTSGCNYQNSQLICRYDLVIPFNIKRKVTFEPSNWACWISKLYCKRQSQLGLCLCITLSPLICLSNIRATPLFSRCAVLDTFFGGLIDLLRSQKNDSFYPGGSAGGDGESYGSRAHIIRHIRNAKNILIAKSKINGFQGATQFLYCLLKILPAF